MIGIDTTFLVQLELAELPAHNSARELLKRECLSKNQPIALSPQVLSEFVHVATDPRRFVKPLTVEAALQKCAFWWRADEVRHVFPSPDSVELFLRWMQQHRLGRKRILDTQLAAILHVSGVTKVFTSNRSDFQIFGFDLLVP